MRFLITLPLLLTLGACATPKPWIDGGPRVSLVLKHRTWEPHGGAEGYIIRASGRTVSIDCLGLPLAIEGSANHLTVTNCQRVTIGGNGNHVRATLGEAATLLVSGDHNRVRWQPVAGATAAIRNIGRDNHVKALPAA